MQQPTDPEEGGASPVKRDLTRYHIRQVGGLTTPRPSTDLDGRRIDRPISEEGISQPFLPDISTRRRTDRCDKGHDWSTISCKQLRHQQHAIPIIVCHVRHNARDGNGHPMLPSVGPTTTGGRRSESAQPLYIFPLTFPPFMY